MTAPWRAIERGVHRSVRALDALVHRLHGWRWNPLHQSGALAAWLLVVLTASGLVLLLFYRVGSPSESVQRIAAQPWLGGWIRGVHRYATDLFVAAALIHAIRLIGQSRTWGPRTRAWVSGVMLFGLAMVCSWTGFVMAWDAFGHRVALAGARLFDVLPILSEPVGRIFAGDRPVPANFFFLNMFIHIAVPLAMGVALWLHVSKVARPVLSPPKELRWGTVGFLILLAVLLPAPLGPAADPLSLPASTPINLATAWWVPLAEGMTPAGVWLMGIMVVTAAFAVPVISRKPRVGGLAPSVVDPRLCTGCNQCPQDCPWGAITMVPRDDNRPTLVALVDPTLCVSCGICAASCAPMGVGPPGRTGRDQLADVRHLLMPAIAARPTAERVVAAVCGRTDAALRSRLAAAGAYLHEVPCVGTIHTSVIELLIRQGARGVFVVGCPPRDCTAREGPKWLEQRVYHDREAELQARVDRRRLRIHTGEAGGAAETVAAFSRFRDSLRLLDAPAAEFDVVLLAECETAAVGEET